MGGLVLEKEIVGGDVLDPPVQVIHAAGVQAAPEQVVEPDAMGIVRKLWQLGLGAASVVDAGLTATFGSATLTGGRP